MVLACGHVEGQRQDQPAVDRHRRMEPAGWARNYLVCQTHYRQVANFQRAAPGLRDKAVSWLMNNSRPNSGRAGEGGGFDEAGWLGQADTRVSGPVHGGSIPRNTWDSL